MNISQLLQSLWQWASSSSATATSFVMNLIAFPLSIFGFYLYFQQKKEYKLLFGMVTEYGLQQKIKEDTQKIEEVHNKLEQEKQRTEQQIKEAQKDLKERLPLDARRAYYENAIPAVQAQIFDLNKQVERMTQELAALDNDTRVVSPEIDAILSEEIRRHMSIRREMEKAQLLLSIFTGGVAATGILFPYPFSLLALPLGIGALRQCFVLSRLWRTYYHVPKERELFRYRIMQALSIAILIGGIFLFLIVIASAMTWNSHKSDPFVTALTIVSFVGSVLLVFGGAYSMRRLKRKAPFK